MWGTFFPFPISGSGGWRGGNQTSSTIRERFFFLISLFNFFLVFLIPTGDVSKAVGKLVSMISAESEEEEDSNPEPWKKKERKLYRIHYRTGKFTLCHFYFTLQLPPPNHNNIFPSRIRNRMKHKTTTTTTRRPPSISLENIIRI